ncbi:MAG TPA: FAD-dependent monooxygenase [Steroidobacter sp.]|uniref:FAD-dependent monooxygenase n=1 Tax=Steroidobacter sp. TaxID=1978227 RepID=UPI002ED91854
MSQKQKIIIVGAGPTGLSAAILLRQRGYEPVVLERRPGITGYPAAHVANTRTMEVFAEMGVADRVWNVGDTKAMSSLVVWVESLAGRQYGVLPIQGSARDERGPLSAFNSVNIPQTRLEGILLDRFIELGGVVRFGEEVVDVRDTGSGVEVSATAADGTRHNFHCDWLLGCDGAGSLVRRAVGIEMQGPRTIARFMTIYFEADLDRFRENRRGLLYWIGGPEARGVFISFDEIGRMWAMLVPIGDLPIEAFDAVAATRIVQKAIGDLGVPVSLNAVSSWNMSAQVATSYRRGRVILAGDACHRFPPTGGLGMNTGIQDSHNLVWKLCAVIDGRAREALIDTYEQERRPIAQRNTDQSVHNLMKMGMIDEALGIQTLAPIAADAAVGPVASWAPEKLNIDGDSPDARRRRAAVQDAIDEQAEHFAQGAGIDLGFSYAEGALVPDGSPKPSNTPCEYRPDAHPGARLPFSSPDNTFANSTLGCVRPSGVTLFTKDPRWVAIAARATQRAGVEIGVVQFGEQGRNLGRNAQDLLGIAPTGAVAVRPDGHVLWRARAMTDDAMEQLATAAGIAAGAPVQESVG